MSQRIYRDAILRISEQEQKISLAYSNIIADSYSMTSFLRELLAQMKQHVLTKGFTNKAEEIEFFRKSNLKSWVNLFTTIECTQWKYHVLLQKVSATQIYDLFSRLAL